MPESLTLLEGTVGAGPKRDFYTILRGTVGSTSHGLGIEGQDDLDEMAVCLESFKDANGLRARFETDVFRTAEERTGKHDARSQHGDLDLTTHTLHKYLRLALKGNPSVLVPLYLPERFLQVRTIEGLQLQGLASKIISKHAINAFLGYLTAQEQKLKGERGTRVHRPELVAKYGYDTKFAMHAIRLGYQGLELAKEHRLSLPMDEVQRQLCRNIRTGKLSIEDVLEQIAFVKVELEAWKLRSTLPDEPDTTAVEKWMLNVYRKYWTLDTFDRSIDEALNSGDGVYRP